MRGKERMLHLKLSSIIECVARGRELGNSDYRSWHMITTKK